jgi:hypothetical protein
MDLLIGITPMASSEAESMSAQQNVTPCINVQFFECLLACISNTLLNAQKPDSSSTASGNEESSEPELLPVVSDISETIKGQEDSPEIEVADEESSEIELLSVMSDVSEAITGQQSLPEVIEVADEESSEIELLSVMSDMSEAITGQQGSPEVVEVADEESSEIELLSVMSDVSEATTGQQDSPEVIEVADEESSEIELLSVMSDVSEAITGQQGSPEVIEVVDEESSEIELLSVMFGVSEAITEQEDSPEVVEATAEENSEPELLSVMSGVSEATGQEDSPEVVEVAAEENSEPELLSVMSGVTEATGQEDSPEVVEVVAEDTPVGIIVEGNVLSLSGVSKLSGQALAEAESHDMAVVGNDSKGLQYSRVQASGAGGSQAVDKELLAMSQGLGKLATEADSGNGLESSGSSQPQPADKGLLTALQKAEESASEKSLSALAEARPVHAKPAEGNALKAADEKLFSSALKADKELLASQPVKPEPGKDLTVTVKEVHSAGKTLFTGENSVRVENIPLHTEGRSETVLTASHGAEPRKVININHHTFVVTKRSDTSIEVSLKPEGLGKLEIEVNIDKGVINAQISASDPVGKEIIERNLPNILNALVKEGLNVGGFSVSLKDRKGAMKEELKRGMQGEQQPAEKLKIPAVSRSNSAVSIFV